MGGIGYRKLPVPADCWSPHPQDRLVPFYLLFDDVGVPFQPLAAIFYVARQPGNADSVLTGETRGPDSGAPHPLAHTRYSSVRFEMSASSRRPEEFSLLSCCLWQPQKPVWGEGCFGKPSHTLEGLRGRVVHGGHVHPAPAAFSTVPAPLTAVPAPLTQYPPL